MGGWEFAERRDLLASAERVADEAVEMCSAKPLGSGLRDLILSPSHAMLTIQRSSRTPPRSTASWATKRTTPAPAS